MDNKRLDSRDQVVEEIMKIHRSLPSRPAIDDVEAATDLIRNIEKEDLMRLDAIVKQTKSSEVPDELFNVLQEMRKGFVHLRSREQKREAMEILDLDSAHVLFDELIQRAAHCLPSSDGSPPALTPPVPAIRSESQVKSKEIYSRDDTFEMNTKSSLYSDGLLAPQNPQISDSSLQPRKTSGHNEEKLSFIKLASLIEASSKNPTQELNLQNRLMNQLEWIPDSIGKLSNLLKLDLSENYIMVLPETLRGLSSLVKLDLHSNRISQLPDSIGDLINLTNLNLSGNQLSSLPSTFTRLLNLEHLDLSSNSLSNLPESIGSLVSLKKLDIETNNIEEIPISIGDCSSLTELRADYNRLKALPEAIGKITSLEILTIRYNNIRQLPTTLSSMAKLKEIDVSFNELESVPESLCLVKTLVKLNIGNNFANLKSLPGSIGDLEMLEEFDMSNNQIRFLPDSFKMLTHLRVLHAQQNPLEVPPRDIIEKGAQAVVEYMKDVMETRNNKSETVKSKKRCWGKMCCFYNNKNRNSVQTV